ncbi:hypothetical protein U3516DRAFT_764026 [Neocallimastix sp. 'constans']
MILEDNDSWKSLARTKLCCYDKNHSKLTLFKRMQVETIDKQLGEMQHFNTTPLGEMQPGEMQIGEMQLSQN